MMRSARTIATELLLRAEAAGQYADRALDAVLSREHTLDARDKSLVTTLFYGVIERRITLDYIIDTHSKVPPSAIEKGVRMTLRVALYQLLFLDRVPDHAAVAEAVEAVSRRSKGFVNALLRQFCREGKRISYPDADFHGGKLYITYDADRNSLREILLLECTEEDIMDESHPLTPRIISKPKTCQ